MRGRRNAAPHHRPRRRLARIEKAFILDALRETNGVQSKAAKLLGINERSLWHRVKKLGIAITKRASGG